MLKNNEFSPEKYTHFIDDFQNTTNMNAYDRLQKKAEERGKEKGKELILMELINKQLAKGFSLPEIADRLDIDIDEVIRIINKYNLVKQG